jgi:hypothetical protein
MSEHVEVTKIKEQFTEELFVDRMMRYASSKPTLDKARRVVDQHPNIDIKTAILAEALRAVQFIEILEMDEEEYDLAGYTPSEKRTGVSVPNMQILSDRLRGKIPSESRQFQLLAAVGKSTGSKVSLPFGQAAAYLK